MSRRRLLQLIIAVGVVSLSGLAAGLAEPPAPEAARPKVRPAKRDMPAGGALKARRRGASRDRETEQSAPPAERNSGAPTISPAGSAGPAPDALTVAARVDALIDSTQAGSSAAPLTNDEDFLRRVSLDLAGVPPTPQQVTLFGLDPNPDKRRVAIDRLLESPEYAENWARYWRDVIYYRATETRPQFLVRAREAFESWMKEQLRANKGWHEIATALLTATGDVTEEGQTALVFAQRAEPDEVAAETSRIFLGIQLQCANCHDHPTDSWKREQFHGLAAFFPRMALRRQQEEPLRTFDLVSFTESDQQRRELAENRRNNPEQFVRRLDRNGDRKISREEATGGPGNGRLLERIFDVADTDKDGLLTIAELKQAPPPPMMDRQGSIEYHMPDLNNPQSQGKRFDPVFFLGDLSPGRGLSDLERRERLARYITSSDNPWFAKAFVNRIWAQLVGEGFYMPVDDIGPERAATAPEALEALAGGFAASGYDIKWLFRAIANTATYQRSIRPRDPRQTSPTFAAATPVRLRGDQLYSALTQAMGIEELSSRRPPREGMPEMRRLQQDPRTLFNQTFGFDPSTPPDELMGTLPQALFFMNSRLIAGMSRGEGPTRLAQILEKFSDNDDALKELYLQVHAREPSQREMQICHEYLRQVRNRREAFEDIQWSLLNSTEFQTKR
ncbi:MAG: DUF1549 domain-containing protein [Planctomycetaceae bacterium]